MIRMVVFDMAGTVINEGNVVYKTLLKAINDEGYRVSLAQVLLAGAGKEKFQAINDILKAYTDAGPAMARRVFANFKTLLAPAYDEMEIMSQPKAENLFQELKNRKIYVVLNTGYDTKTAQSMLSKVGWEEGKNIDALVTAGHVAHHRPHPDMIEFAKKRFDLKNSSEVIKVGDSAVDIEEGQNAKCRLCIGITTGAQSREQLLAAKPDYVIDALSEVWPLIEKLN